MMEVANLWNELIPPAPPLVFGRSGESFLMALIIANENTSVRRKAKLRCRHNRVDWAGSRNIDDKGGKCVEWKGGVGGTKDGVRLMICGHENTLERLLGSQTKVHS